MSGCRLPTSCSGPGRAYEIAQGRLGPGRVHHCMRAIGLAERSLELACQRALSRTAFGKPIAKLGGNLERIADARIAINRSRLLVMHAAWLLDQGMSTEALSAVSEIKVEVPAMALDVDRPRHPAARRRRDDARLPARSGVGGCAFAAPRRRSRRGAPQRGRPDRAGQAPVSAVTGAKPVRTEDAFDVDAAVAWLRANTDPRYAAGLAGVPEVLQFSGGASNLTYLLRFPDLDLVLRRGPSGTKAKGAHDMGREHRIQAALAPVFPYVATMVAFCDDPAVLGGDFYVMERLVGTVPRREMPVELSRTRRAACARPCSTSSSSCTRSTRSRAGSTRSARARATSDVRSRAGRPATARRTRAASPTSSTAMAWLDEHQPDDVRSGVIHNDYKLDNLVLAEDDPTRIVGIFDWEMATIGDPLMDLGAALAYWVQADDDEDFQAFRRVPTHLPGMLTRDQMIEGYCRADGLDLTARQALFYQAYGVFRLAVIAQQIYYRYANGQTTNEAYAVFGPAVQILDRRLRQARCALTSRPAGWPGRRTGCGRLQITGVVGVLAYRGVGMGSPDVEVRRSRSGAAP